MARKSRFPGPGILADGEAQGRTANGFMRGTEKPPYGFRAQTVNGTAQCEGLGWNQSDDWPSFPAQEGGAWQRGGNRTGE